MIFQMPARFLLCHSAFACVCGFVCLCVCMRVMLVPQISKGFSSQLALYIQICILISRLSQIFCRRGIPAPSAILKRSFFFCMCSFRVKTFFSFFLSYCDIAVAVRAVQSPSALVTCGAQVLHTPNLPAASLPVFFFFFFSLVWCWKDNSQKNKQNNVCV